VEKIAAHLAPFVPVGEVLGRAVASP
jgi:hypothetical protein